MNKEDLKKLKEKYEDVFEVEIANRIFIFRALGRIEYATIVMQNYELGDFQEKICEVATIYPTGNNFGEGLAGVAEILSDFIIDASGSHAGQIFDILMEHREEMENFDFQIDSIIHEVYPEFRIDEIEKWPIRKTLYYYSRAEWVLRNVRGIETETFFLLDELIKRRIESLYSDETDEVAEETEKETDVKEEVRSDKEILMQEFTEVPVSGGFSSAAPVTKESVVPLVPEKKEVKKDNKNNEEEARRVLNLMNQEAASRGMNIGALQKSIPSVLPEQKMFEYQEDLHGKFD